LQKNCTIGRLTAKNVYSDRKNGYIQALLDNNLPVDESLILILKTLSTEESEKATKKL
jgi:LacI family transcriptional regulator